MGNFDTTKMAIKNVIKKNNNQEITGDILQTVLINMLNNIGVGFIFGGIADPTTKPESLTGTNAPVFYISNKVGTYVNFDSIVVNENELAFLVNGSDKKWKKFSINIPIATILNDGLLAKKDKAYIETLKPWLIAHDNVTTIDALNQELNAFGTKTAQGLHEMKCFGIPLFVTFANLNVGDSILMQTIQGSITFNSTKTSIASINTVGNLTIAVRYYQSGKWGTWNTPLSQINPPTAQTGTSGTKVNYVYSQGKSQDTKTIITSKFWIYKHGDYNLFLRFKHWGANNDEAEENYSQVQLPNAWTGSNGLLRRDIYARLDAFELREQNSTATDVKIVTPIFTTGGTRELIISRATTAKAGVMTAKDKARLNKLKFAKVVYNLAYTTQNEVAVDKYPSNSEDYVAGNYFNMYYTPGKDLPAGTNPMKRGIWFGEYLGPTAGYKRYNTKSICGISSEDLYNLVPNDNILFVDDNKNIVNLTKDSGGISIEVNKTLETLLTVNDIIKLSK